MFSPKGCRRGFPREPGPWWGPPPPHAYGPQDIWDKPPWEHHHRRGRGRWHQLSPWDSRPLPGPADSPWNEEEDRSWAARDCVPPPPWDDRGDNQGPEDFFREDWYPEPGPNSFGWLECPEEEQHRPWPPASLPRERGGFRPRGYHGVEGRRCRPQRRDRRELIMVQHLRCPRPSRGKHQSSKPSPCSGTSQPGVKDKPQHPEHPQTLTSCKDDVQSKEQTPQGPSAASGEVPASPKPAEIPEKSLAADSQEAVTEAVEPEQVDLGAGQKPADSHSQGPSALEMEPDLLDKSSAGTGEQLEVEPCSQSVPKAGAGGGSPPHSPTAPADPAERVPTAAGSTGEEGAELSPCCLGQQHLPSGAGEAEGEAAHDGVPAAVQPPENSQVLPQATAGPDSEPSQACSEICTAPETSPGTQHPPGSGETEPAAGEQHQLCSSLPTPSPSSTDLRSAAVLARKEEIELSYQQFSLTIAVVATMLLQKEPSMEASLGLALRANLRQGRIHHLRELEDFINSYDSATLSR